MDKMSGGANSRVKNTVLFINEHLNPTTPKPPNYAEINMRNAGVGHQDNRILRYGAIRDGTPGGVDNSLHTPGADTKAGKVPNVPVISFNVAEFL